jgi:Concanavalin A-like lectin/glucanases superfamily
MKKANPNPSTFFGANLFTALVLVALNLAFVPLVTAADVLDSSLIVRLNFDAAPVGNVIVDTSPAGGHPGTNNLATWVASVASRQGVMNFDGTVPNQITVGAAPALNSSVGTIAFWMNSTNVTQLPNPYVALFDRRTAGGDIIFQDPNGHLEDQARQATGGGANSQTTGANLTDGKWHHVAYVYNQAALGTVSFYIDGVIDTTATNTLAWSWVPDLEVDIGATANDNGFWAGYTGFLDDFRIYNRMLSAAEIADVAGLGTTPQIVISAGGQPQDLTVAVNDTPSLTVKATVVNGDPTQLHYQWQKNDSNINGATNSTYSFTASAVDSNATFRVQLSYAGATNVTSAEATLTVIPEMVLIYSFDAAPVGDVIVDTTTNTIKHNGTNVGAVWVASESGRTGVMSFDGSLPSQITVAPAPELDSVRGTIAFWMESSNVTQLPNPYAALFDRRAEPADALPTTGGDIIYQGPNGHLDNQAQAPGAGTVNAQSIGFLVTDGKWHHIAYLYDQRAGGSVSFYVDGALDTTKVNSQPWAWVPQEELEIGKSHDSFWSGYTGFLDEFRIYNRVLAPSEIAQLAGIGPQPQIVISRQPANLVTGSNDNPSFSVTASVVNGDVTKLGYQWQKEDVNISNATNSSYTFLVTAANDGKRFRVQLSYPGTTNVTSVEATLTVLPDFVVHFAFDAAPQADVIVDSSPGTNHNGMNVGATWVASQDGRTGVMSFDPTVPSQITLAGVPDLNSMRGTIAFWMESTLAIPAPSTEVMLLDRRAMPADNVPITGGDVIYQLIPDGHVSDQAEVAGRSRANQFSTVANPTDGKWHHFAYVYDQTAIGFISYYIDGVLDGSHNNSQSWYWVTDETIELGKSHDTYWSAYNGFLDDFRIYNRVLSAGEIAALAGVVAPPILSFTEAGGKLTLTWLPTGFVLQQNSQVANAAGWTNVANGAVSPVVITLPPAGANFYRLKKP